MSVNIWSLYQRILNSLPHQVDIHAKIKYKFTIFQMNLKQISTCTEVHRPNKLKIYWKSLSHGKLWDMHVWVARQCSFFVWIKLQDNAHSILFLVINAHYILISYDRTNKYWTTPKTQPKGHSTSQHKDRIKLRLEKQA